MNIRMYVFLTAIFFLSNVFPAAESYNVTAEGRGTDMESALKAAQKNAVEKAIGVYIKSESKMKNYMSENDEVISSSQGFISSYDIIDSEKDEDGMWTVTISAVVPDFEYIFKEKAKKAALYSGLIPGAGQIYKGRSLRGSLFLGAEAGLIAGIFIADGNMSDAIDDRDDPENLLVWDFYNDKVSKWKNIRTTYYIAAAVVHLYNIYDAYSVTPLLKNLEASAVIGKDKLGLSLVYKF
ncbi:MAG: hypothetical protein PHH55_02090 [Candidatus Delongbacteria bacterium]|nr:hypothetical protein [Candidatus Delongbacteria bacterium]